MKKKFIFLTILSVSILSIVSICAQNTESTKNIIIKSKPLINGMVSLHTPIIDIRTPKEWKETGVIPNSHLITFYEENSSYDEKKFLSTLSDIVTKEDTFLILCRSGNRSNKVANFLSSKGYNHVINLSGGINEAIKNNIQTVPYKPN